MTSGSAHLSRIRSVLVADVDESGSTGDPPGGASVNHSLGCVLLVTEDLPHAFDSVLDYWLGLESTGLDTLHRRWQPWGWK
jgi:hypothetical protein